jgi:hypothetical protein
MQAFLPGPLGLVLETQMTRTPLEDAKVRQGREGGRESEDDAAKRKLGQQGMPERPGKPDVLDQDEMQNPKPLDDGGHTA